MSVTLKSITPNPTTVGTSTTASVHFEDTGTGSTDITVILTENIVNSAGTVLKTQHTSLSMHTGIAKGLSTSFTPSASGTYTVQGIAKDSAGNVLGQNLNLGTITVN